MDALQKHLIVALDVDTPDRALALATALQGRVAMLKVGLELYCKAGLGLLDQLADLGHKIFLDLKFHDIPNTVAGAVRVVARHPAVRLLTIHASGGAAMISAARRAVDEVTQSTNDSERPKILAVTALTSLSDVTSIGVEKSIESWAEQLGRLALDSGADGLVASAHEAAPLRAALGDDFTLVTPGIRLPGDDVGDQARVMTPRRALDDGSTYLVMGRSITQFGDKPDEISRALDRLHDALKSNAL